MLKHDESAGKLTRPRRGLRSLLHRPTTVAPKLGDLRSQLIDATVLDALETAEVKRGWFGRRR